MQAMAATDAMHEATRIVTLQRHALSVSSSTAREVAVKTISKDVIFSRKGKRCRKEPCSKL